MRLTLFDLSAEDHRHIAAAIDGLDPAHQPCRRLTREAAGELAEMRLAGRTPTIGWWRNHAPRGANDLLSALVPAGTNGRGRRGEQ